MYKNLMLAFGAVLSLTGCVSEVSEFIGESEPAHISQAENLEGTENLKVQVNLGLGSLEVTRGDAEKLFDLDIDYDGKNDKPKIRFTRDGSSALLRIELEGKKGSGWLQEDNRITLELSPEVELAACFVTGVGENQVDLTGLKVGSLEVVNGVGHAEIHMDEVNRAKCGPVKVTNGIGHLEMTGIGNYGFSDFAFTGGIGDSTLDYSGTWDVIGDIEIKVGLGSLEVDIPEELGVRIRTSKSFLSNIQMPGFSQVGNEYLSGNIDETEKKIVISLNTGIGGVSFVHR